MRKIVVIFLISTTLIAYGCRKEENTSNTVKENIPTSKQENISGINILSEEGTIIQNAAIPKSEDEGMNSIMSITTEDFYYLPNYDNGTFTYMDENQMLQHLFWQAMYDNDTVKMNEILQNGFDINTPNENKETALYYAIRKNEYELLQFLINKGAYINCNSNTINGKFSPLSFAMAIHSNEKLLDILLSNNVDMYCANGNQWTNLPLYVAIHNNNIAGIKKMIEYGLDINYNYNQAYNILDITPILHFILKSYHSNPSNDYKTLIEFLISNNVDINQKNSKGQTPLMYALELCDVLSSKLLITSGADIMIKDNHGKSALDYAKNNRTCLSEAGVSANEYENIINLLYSKAE